MSDENSSRPLPSPWKDFLGEIDNILSETRVLLTTYTVWSRLEHVCERVRVDEAMIQISITKSRVAALSDSNTGSLRSNVASLPFLWIVNPNKYASVTC
jgi:hypothetical protein